MTRVAVTKGTLRIPPTYFAIQHTEKLRMISPGRFTVRTFAMALQLDDPALRAAVATGDLDLVEVAGLVGGAFRRREVTMPFSFQAMTRAVRAFEPDVIHQHFATWSSPAVHAAVLSRAPLLVTTHGADVFAALRPLAAVPFRDRPMLAWHHRSVHRAFKHAHTVLAVSRYLAGQAVAAGADPGRVEVHYQGVDTDFFRPDQSVALPHTPEVLFVGAFSTAKGVIDLVQASVGARARADHRLVLIGGGSLSNALKAASEEAQHIDVVGFLDRLAVRERIRRASVLVLPTQLHDGWREAAGLVLLEAQACGVPVITYDSGGAPEMLEDGRTGVVVPELDISALETAIVDVLHLSSAERAAMQRRARDFVVAHRSLDASARTLADLYVSAAGAS